MSEPLGPTGPSGYEPGEAVPGRPGLPWESADEGRSPGSALETLRLVLLAPADAFSRMLVTGNLGDPILFLLVFGTAGTCFGLLWQSTLRTFVGRLAGGDLGEIALVNSFGLFTLFLAPVFVLLWAAILAAVYHVALLLFGGAPRPFETTLRVVCYSHGATYLLLVVPLCGGLIAAVWSLVAAAVGLREAHEVPGGRAAAAVIAPLLLICGCCIVLWILVIGMAVAIPGMVN